MAYTLKQLTMAWTAVHGGVAPTVEELAQLQLRTNASFGDKAALAYVLNSADNSTALAALSYQFFTGKSPTKAGMAFLTNSPDNPNDLNDAYYAKFNIENRYINFAANLGVAGEGASAFAGKYGAMSFSDYIASIYETIVGSSYATAAGVDPAAAIAYLVGRQDAILATAKSAGMITPGMSQAQIDLAVKAAAAGFLMGEAIKADVGLYAAAANNFMLAVATGTATYNTDITTTYKPAPGQGAGQSVTTAPPVDAMPGYVPPPPPPPPPTPLTFTLTTGADTFRGENLGDTFNATPAAFNASDVLNGGGGNDTLNIGTTYNGNYTPAAATLTSIETVNITNTLSGVYFDASGWTSVTKLTVTDKESTQITAGATQDVTITNTNQGNFTFIADGGHDMTVSIANSGGTVRVGTNTAPTGALVFTRASAGPGVLNIVVGTSADITLTATNGVNSTLTPGTVVIDGTALTTAIKVKGSPTITADTNTAGHSGDNFTINSNAGAITTLEADGFNTVNLSGSAVTTLKIAHGANMSISNSAGPSAATTLTATVDAFRGDFWDQAVYQTLNIIREGGASNLDLGMNALKTLTISGSSALTLYIGNGATALETITVTGAGAVDLTMAANPATLDASNASGAITAYVDSAVTTVTTGSGADTISTTDTISKAIDLGAGDDTLFLSGATSTITEIVDGGNGTDTVWMDAVDAHDYAALYGSKIRHFERLHLDNGLNFTIDLVALGGYHYVEAEDGNGVTLNGLVSGDTLALMKAGTAYVVGSANFGNANDTFNIRLTSDGTGALNYGSVDLSGVETVAITLDDTRATPTGADRHVLTVLDTAAKVITITGDAGLELISNSTALTSVDASGITKGDFRLTTGALGGAATIKGSATGSNGVDFSAAAVVITYEGGAGDDVITASNGVGGNVIHLGDGANYFTGNGGTTSAITAGSGDDYIRVDNGGATINAGNGGNVVFALSNTASTITTGTGDDNIFVGGGANTVDVGSGFDYVGIKDATATASGYTTITGMGAGDKLEFSNVTFGQTTAGAAVADLAAATAGDGTGNILKWFVAGGDTYVVVDLSGSTSFVDGVDYIVKLVGVHNLNQAGNMAAHTVTLVS